MDFHESWEWLHLDTADIRLSFGGEVVPVLGVKFVLTLESWHK